MGRGQQNLENNENGPALRVQLPVLNVRWSRPVNLEQEE